MMKPGRKNDLEGRRTGTPQIWLGRFGHCLGSREGFRRATRAANRQLTGSLKLAGKSQSRIFGVVQEGGRIGPLNDCAILIPVRDPERAIQTIKTELKCAALLEVCQIGIISDAAGWRCVYPSSEVKMEWLLDSERQELYTSQFIEGVDNFLRKAAGEAGDNK